MAQVLQRELFNIVYQELGAVYSHSTVQDIVTAYQKVIAKQLIEGNGISLGVAGKIETSVTAPRMRNVIHTNEKCLTKATRKFRMKASTLVKDMANDLLQQQGE